MKKLSASAWWAYAGLWLLLLLLALPYFKDPKYFSILNYADLAFHESGHYVFFAWAGEFLRILGGTLAQLLIPLGFGVYFLAFRREIMAGLACGYWLAENLIYVAVYMADARFMILPLLGDPDSHDWNYLFSKMNLLHQSTAIAGVIRGIGVMGILLSLGLMFFLLFMQNPFMAPAQAPDSLPEPPDEVREEKAEAKDNSPFKPL